MYTSIESGVKYTCIKMSRDRRTKFCQSKCHVTDVPSFSLRCWCIPSLSLPVGLLHRLCSQMYKQNKYITCLKHCLKTFKSFLPIILECKICLLPGKFFLLPISFSIHDNKLEIGTLTRSNVVFQAVLIALSLRFEC